MLEKGQINLEQELKLCSEMLNKDTRNCKQNTKTNIFKKITIKIKSTVQMIYFHSNCWLVSFCAVHCWNYRRQVAERANTPANEEFQYTT
jgi:hypothetical protein